MNYSNPFTEMMKNFGEIKAPAFGAVPTLDVNQLLSVSRKNAEAFAAAGQAMGESLQNITRRQAELVRTQIEKTLKSAKDALVNGSPEINTTKQVELAKTMFESSCNNVREVCELVSKSNLEVFDTLNRRTSASIEELTATATATSATNKRKAA